jgi:hypothetical protein
MTVVFGRYRLEVDYVELEAWPLEDGSPNVETEPLIRVLLSGLTFQ